MKISTHFKECTVVDWAVGLVLCWGVAYLFYRSIVAMILLSIGSVFIIQLRQHQRVEKKKWKLTLEFKDGIQSLSNALAAGYSIENAFPEVIRELRFLYDEDAVIIKEFQNIHQQIRLNRNVEDLLIEFGSRSGVEDILNFSEVVTTAKRTGGDLIKIMKATSENISDKIEIQREIATLIAAKRLEGNIMCVIPVGIIVYLSVCMPDFLSPLYEGVIGRLVMSGALTGYVAGVLLLNRIVNIKI